MLYATMLAKYAARLYATNARRPESLNHPSLSVQMTS
jgi:hypothetical protein